MINPFRWLRERGEQRVAERRALVKAIAEAQWKVYTDWRDAQKCIGCGKPFAAGGKWVTEYHCWDCALAGIPDEATRRAARASAEGDARAMGMRP